VEKALEVKIEKVKEQVLELTQMIKVQYKKTKSMIDDLRTNQIKKPELGMFDK
jgi:hypothetical protein